MVDTKDDLVGHKILWAIMINTSRLLPLIALLAVIDATLLSAIRMELITFSVMGMPNI
jgi:hypothetical protein